jgi:hypothetical protein
LATSEFHVRSEISEAMSELTDADLVFEVTAKSNRSLSRDSIPIQPIEQAVEATLHAFAASVETHVERVAILEEVSRSCLTIWFRFHAFARSETEDRGRAVDLGLLKYVAQGLLTIVSWLDGRTPLRLSDLQQALKLLAWSTSATSGAHPVLPSSVNLARAVTAWGRVKEILRDSGSARLVLQQGSIELDLSKSVPELTSLVEKKLVNRTVEMILLVERPDYGGTGEWLFKHGQAHFAAGCRACDLLDRFYRREADIRPGDALHCVVEFDTSYGPDHEVVDEKLSVIDVIEVLSLAGSVKEKTEQQPNPLKVDRKSDNPAKERMLIL